MKREALFLNILQKKLVFCIVFFVFIGCNSTDENESVIRDLAVNIKLDRFDLKFYGQGPEALPELKKKYPYLFPKQFTDSVWISRQQDSLQLILQKAVGEVFEDTSQLEEKINHLFKHLKFHFPTVKTPHVVTLTNNVDYQIKTVYSDSILLISLDTFLGASHELYQGIPNYIRKELDQIYIPSQIVEKFASYNLPPEEDRTFLAQMLFEGKKMYLQDLLLPHEADWVKIAYSEKELNWVKENELYIWQYFIEQQILYKTDPKLVQRFLEPAPFSKFYLQLDNESPGRVGRWIGWQIIKSYINQNPETPLEALLKMPAQELFQRAKYKPKR